MAHEHSVYDNDKHFRIDPVTRQIENTSDKVVLIQHDHDSERFTFEIPKTVEDHDMSLCNVVQIHYLNIEAATKTDNEGIYEVDDLQSKNIINQQGEKEDVVVFSWLISRNATQYVGSLNFVVRFKCVANDGTVTYEWATAIHKGIAVSDSIYNSEVIASEYADVLEKWRASLFFNTDGVTEDVAMGGYKITGMGAPTDKGDAATKEYVDNAVKNIDLSGVDASDKVSKAGDIMAGQLDMNTNKIIGLGDPEYSTDAANKRYVDEKVGNIDVTGQLSGVIQQINELSAEVTEKIDNKLGMVKVWENASNLSTFSKQTLTLPALLEYDLFAIECDCGTFFININECDIKGLAGTNVIEGSSMHCYVNARAIEIEVDDAVYVEIGNAYQMSLNSSDYEQDNTSIVPYRIYGVLEKE